MNAIYSKETDWRVELLCWEDTLPGAGRPQELINTDLDKADLFIGCLWRRWGTPSGRDDKTGFEEEFERSFERRIRTGSPEVWLFFKQIDAVAQRVPDQQLQKVLTFRERVAAEKQLLFKDFSDTNEWRETIFGLLHRRLMRLLIARQSEGKEGQAGTLQRNAATTHSTGESSRAEAGDASPLMPLITLLGKVERKLRSEKTALADRLDPLPASEAVRLLLFASTNYNRNVQHVEFGTHEINSVYFHRCALDLTGPERLFLCRAILLDKSRTKPGWFWVAGKRISGLLRWFAVHDSEELMRVCVVEWATRIGLALCRRNGEGEAAISRLLSDESESVRLAALGHLSALGRKADLKQIEPLLHDSSKTVRILAEQTSRLVRLRIDPDGETKRSLERFDPFDERMVAVVGGNVAMVSDSTLVMILGSTSDALKAIAAKELARRRRITPTLACSMCESDINAVRQCGFMAKVDNGEALDPSQIRSALIPTLMSFSLTENAWNKADPDAVIAAYFDRLPQDELWRRVHAVNENSHIALNTIGRHHFLQNVHQIRTHLRVEFCKLPEARLLAQPRSPAPRRDSDLFASLLGDVPSAFESAQNRLRSSALEILAAHPDNVDRELFLRFLLENSGGSDQIIACLNGLSKVGRSEDRDRVEGHLKSPISAIHAAAVRAYLALSSNKVIAAKNLLLDPNEYRVWLVTQSALQSKERSLWPVLKPLLGHENEEIRRFICFFAVSTLKRPAVEGLLREYLGRGRYFYNVVTLLDRALYAPRAIRDSLRREEQAFFEEWKPSEPWSWK